MNDPNSSDTKYLSWFINEDLYIIPEDIPPVQTEVEKPSEIVPKAEVKINEPKESLTESIPEENIRLLEISGKPDSTVLVISNTLSGEEKKLLSQILNAVDLAMDQIALIDNQSIETKNAGELMNIPYQKALYFLSGHQELIPDLPQQFYKIAENEGKLVLRSENLSEIANDRNKKRSLWEQLKILFKK